MGLAFDEDSWIFVMLVILYKQHGDIMAIGSWYTQKQKNIRRQSAVP